MSQNFSLYSTSREAPTLRAESGDAELAFAGAIPIAYLALFDPTDIVVLPGSGCSELSLFTSKPVALERLTRRIPTLAARVADDLSALARRQARKPGGAGGLTPGQKALRLSLEAFAGRVEAAPGERVQAFLWDSYFSWQERERASLATLITAADGAAEGWRFFRSLAELDNETTRPWGHEDVANVLTGLTADTVLFVGEAFIDQKTSR